MNNQFGNQPPQGGNQFQTPPPSSGPFEQPPGMGNYQQPGMQPAPSGGSKSWILIVLLVIVLILAGLVFASWQGWISLGGLEKYWGGKGKTSTTTTPTETTTEPSETTTTETKTLSNDDQRKADLASIKSALQKYYQANNSYPSASIVQKTLDPNCVLNSALVPTYLSKLPVDPLTPTYYYGYMSDGKTFQLTAILEDKTDAAGIQVGNNFIYKVTDSSVETTSSSTESNSTNSTESTTKTTEENP